MPRGPRATEREAQLDDLQQFLLHLASSLTAAGDAVNQIEEKLRAVAAAYGAPDATIAVLPTLAVVSLEPGSPTTIEPTQQLRGALRLDQTSELFALLREAERGEIDPKRGSDRVLEIIAMKPTYGTGFTVLGHVILTVGLCLVLQPTPGDLVLAAIFGAIVALLKLVGGRWSSVEMVMPVLAAFVVAGTTFLLAGEGWADADLRAMIAPLVAFLPGAMLTMAVVELAAADMIAGASRLVSGAFRLLLLAFGIVAAAQVVGLPATEHLTSRPENLLGWWAPWLGVLVFGVGAYFFFSAPRGALPWLWVVLLAAWVGQKLGDLALGGYLSGFFGGLAMILVAYACERRPGGPPALVTFLPSFWLLVPGSLGLIGLTEYLDLSRAVGIQDFLGTIGAMLAIALGILVGYPLYRSFTGATELVKSRRDRTEGEGVERSSDE